MAKLVRDRLIDIIRANGEEPKYHEASPAEYGQALPSKLEEELAEYLANPCVEELADMEQVIQAIAKYRGWDLEAARQKKEQERGGFEKRYILE
jgi:predicted house-cleaning noncanonical NTP pyrophosphatase (MazG superfamily)